MERTENALYLYLQILALIMQERIQSLQLFGFIPNAVLNFSPFCFKTMKIEITWVL